MSKASWAGPRACQAHFWAGPSGVQHLKLAGGHRHISSGSKGGTVGLITFIPQIQGKGYAGTQSVRKLGSFLLRMKNKQTNILQPGPPKQQTAAGGILPIVIGSPGVGGGQPGSICFGYRRVSGREPGLKVRAPAAEANPAMHLLRPLLPILMPPCPVCTLPLEICDSVLWAMSMFSLVRTHTPTHVCLCGWVEAWHMCM